MVWVLCVWHRDVDRDLDNDDDDDDDDAIGQRHMLR
jgi:hypothetical protein